jgi:hypothetical protein
MSYYFFFSDQETSELSEDFNPPIILENDGFYEIGLTVAVVRDSRADVELATSLEDRRSQQYTWRDIVECVLVFIFLFITAVFW